MTDRELVQQALEALEDIFGKNKIDVGVINRLRDRLAQPEQPIQCMCGICKLGPRQWQGLTDDEKRSLVEWAHPDIIDAIELKLRERNT